MDLFNSPKFDNHVQDLLERWHVPGLAVAVVQDQTLHSRGFGHASLSQSVPVTPDTLFDIASASKSLTAASVALLVEDDDNHPLVQWTTPMSQLLPEDFVMSDNSYTENVTVEDVLSHRTGLPGHDLSYVGARSAYPDTPQSVTRNLRNLELAYPIRTKYMYCNLMFTVASYLVEQISGMPFAKYLKTHFFGPLEMSSTHYLPSATIKAGLKDRMATPYAWKKEKEEYLPLEYDECPESQGAGSIFTSVNDYIKYVKALMHQESPFSEEVYRGVTRPRTFTNPDEDLDKLAPLTSMQAYATGWEIFYYRGHKVVQHDGAIPGFSSTHFFVPKFKFGGVILVNADSYPPLILARELIDEALGVPEDERPDWNTILGPNEDQEPEDLRQKLCPGIDGKQPQKTPLSEYVGRYWSAGYKGMTVEIKDDLLFIEATDRSMGMTLSFEHVCDQKKYIAHGSDYFDKSAMEFAAEFEFVEGKVARLGIDFEEDVGHLIWFDKEKAQVLVQQGIDRESHV